MNKSRNIALTLALALGTAAVPALAAEVLVYREVPTRTYYYVPSAPTYTYVETAPATRYYVAPSTDYATPSLAEIYTERPVIVEQPVIVEAPRMTEDQRITSDVMDVLASDSRLSGTIGVQTNRREVELSGLVTTPGQARRAERDARSVVGVDNVRNELRAKVGGMP